MTKNKKYNIFVCGLSGSGKDSISNYLRDEHDFIKLRIAGTIKHIICEKRNIPFDKLDEEKRNNPELRELHHTTGNYLGDETNSLSGTINRIHQLIDGNAVDFDMFKNSKTKHKIICDVRSKIESEIFLKAGYIGIYLRRRPNEHRHLGHFTESNLFENGELLEMIKNYPNNKFLLIFNDNDINYVQEIQNWINITQNNPNVYCLGTNGVLENIYEFINYNIFEY